MKTVTLVLGGARSGKSGYAQELAKQFKQVSFLATARPEDAEMRRKIARHRRERPSCWKTLEVPVSLADAIRSEGEKSDVLLVDCLTLYLANAMKTKNDARAGMSKNFQYLCEAMRKTKASVIAVSNEVGSGIVPAFRSGRIYRDLLGELNKEVAASADRVVLMVAGVPITIKDQATRGLR